MSDTPTTPQPESKRGIYLTVAFLVASGALMFWMMLKSDRQYGPGIAMQNDNAGDPEEAAGVDGPPVPGTEYALPGQDTSGGTPTQPTQPPAGGVPEPASEASSDDAPTQAEPAAQEVAEGEVIAEEPDDGLAPEERLEIAIMRAIDASLEAGEITPQQARERREELARERDERLREEAAAQ